MNNTRVLFDTRFRANGRRCVARRVPRSGETKGMPGQHTALTGRSFVSSTFTPRRDLQAFMRHTRARPPVRARVRARSSLNDAFCNPARRPRRSNATAHKRPAQRPSRFAKARKKKKRRRRRAGYYYTRANDGVRAIIRQRVDVDN